VPRVAAVGDVHGPRYIKLLNASLSKLSNVSLLLLAGDMVDKGAAHHCKLVLSRIRSVYRGPIIGIFGNEEYDERKSEIARLCNDVEWLDDELEVVEVEGCKVAVVGTRGVLDRPTRWQLRNIPGIRELYRSRLSAIESLLKQARLVADCTILLTHYAPICRTLEGENERIWSQLGSRRLTRLILRLKPDIVVHGHAHNSRRPVVRLGDTVIYNVALPAVEEITVMAVGPRGLSAFF